MDKYNFKIIIGRDGFRKVAAGAPTLAFGRALAVLIGAGFEARVAEADFAGARNPIIGEGDDISVEGPEGDEEYLGTDFDSADVFPDPEALPSPGSAIVFEPGEAEALLRNLIDVFPALIAPAAKPTGGVDLTSYLTSALSDYPLRGPDLGTYPAGNDAPEFRTPEAIEAYPYLILRNRAGLEAVETEAEARAKVRTYEADGADYAIRDRRTGEDLKIAREDRNTPTPDIRDYGERSPDENERIAAVLSRLGPGDAFELIYGLLEAFPGLIGVDSEVNGPDLIEYLSRALSGYTD